MLRRVSVSLAAFLLVAQSAHGAESGYKQLEPSLALIGYPTKDTNLPIAFGTGFCVTSSPSKSFFVTNNHVVTDEQGKLAPNLFAIFPKDPKTRYKASIVRQDSDNDLAVVSIDLPCDATVKAAPTLPAAGTPIAIAGFPFTEVCGLAAMCGARNALPHASPDQLQPDLRTGEVNAKLKEGAYWILYDAKAENGDSGGPLFDRETGLVYGVVVAALTEGVPQSWANGAISMTVALPIINKAPVSVDTVRSPGTRGPASGGPDRYAWPVLGSADCRVAWRGFDKAYGEWAQMHGQLQSVADFVKGPGHENRRGELQTLAERLVNREAAALDAMRTQLTGLRNAQATDVLKPATALTNAVSTVNSADAVLATSLPTPGKPMGNGTSTGDLQKAAGDMDSVVMCQ